ncbi:L-rhamnose-binding lectin SML-like [Vanacampus margaritifer]
MSSSFGIALAILLMATCLLFTAVESAEQVTSCDSNQWQVHRLSCDHGVLKVLQALYGRSSSLVCAAGRPQQELSNTQCARQNTKGDLEARCNGKKSCELSLADFRTPDPCVNTLKYLQTNFTCLPALTVVACEGSVAHLYCDSGRFISIMGAYYGRSDQTTCVYRREPNGINNIECLHRATDYAAKSCNGKRSCSISASNSLFGDPCRGTYKYLEISYSCKY